MKNSARTELRALIALAANEFFSPKEGAANSAELSRLTGELSSYPELLFGDGSIATKLVEGFDAALLAGVSRVQFKTIRLAAFALPTKTFQGVIIKQTITMLCLIEEARLIAATNFVTRSQAQLLMEEMSEAFSVAMEYASDLSDTDSYRALVALSASLTRDINARAVRLPEIITYKLPRSRPSLTLANTLYGDATRAEELERENAPYHPAFMPMRGVALTS